MSDFVLSGCSTADLSKEYFMKRNISYICFHYELDGTAYKDDLGESMNFADFYQAMRDGADTKTFQINADEFCEYFDPILASGKDILHVCLSSGITGVLNSALIAQEEMQEKYPDRKIYIVDSLAASSGFGLLLDKLADRRDEGKSIDEVYDFAEKHKKEVNHWFFTSDLTFFIKGGRVTKTAGFVGQVMNICPLLNVDFEGRLIPRQKIRTKKKVMLEQVNKMETLAKDRLNYCEKCFISNSDCREDAEMVAAMIEERFPHLNGKVEIFDIGTTIGSHTGPGTVALFFWGDERVD